MGEGVVGSWPVKATWWKECIHVVEEVVVGSHNDARSAAQRSSSRMAKDVVKCLMR